MEHFFEEEFKEKVLDSELPVLMDFYANWCGPCRALGPHVKNLAESHKDKLKVIQVDCDECPNLAAEFEIKTIPTLVIMKNGEEVAKHIGTINKDNLIKFVEKHI